MSALVKITNAAKTQLLSLLRTRETNVALFSVEGGGCNGLRYSLKPDSDPPQPTDEDISIGDDAVLRVCGKSALFVIGTEIDWKEDSFMGQNFTFTNENAASTCGCGETFAPKAHD